MRVVHILIISLLFFAIVLSLWFANYHGYIYPVDGGSDESRGTFGDSFGSINALFAGLAFAGIAVSIFIQTDQLKVSRAEMTAAQNTLTETTNDLKKQNDAVYKQSFETTFFQLIALWNGIAGELIAAYSDRSSPPRETLNVGRGAFEAYRILVIDEYTAHAKNWSQEPYKIEGEDEDTWEIERSRHKAFLMPALTYLYEQHGDDLRPYYRTLHTMMNFIRESSLPDKDKPFYAEIIRAQMTAPEVTMLAMNAIFELSDSNFHVLVSDYKMLANANNEDRLLKTFSYLIDKRAFGGSSQ